VLYYNKHSCCSVLENQLLQAVKGSSFIQLENVIQVLQNYTGITSKIFSSCFLSYVQGEDIRPIKATLIEGYKAEIDVELEYSNGECKFFITMLL
jgi:hypothetical protein